MVLGAGGVFLRRSWSRSVCTLGWLCKLAMIPSLFKPWVVCAREAVTCTRVIAEWEELLPMGPTLQPPEGAPPPGSSELSNRELSRSLSHCLLHPKELFAGGAMQHGADATRRVSVLGSLVARKVEGNAMK